VHEHPFPCRARLLIAPPRAAGAGISEGMLSGCCGALGEQTRRQLYIIRTSGARLLSLINDVMDAAVLRRDSLVLKQEKVGTASVTKLGAAGQTGGERCVWNVLTPPSPRPTRSMQVCIMHVVNGHSFSDKLGAAGQTGGERCVWNVLTPPSPRPTRSMQVCIMHVVDDVLDLTRSLVNPDVELQNRVTPDLLVLGDTGRIVQVSAGASVMCCARPAPRL